MLQETPLTEPHPQVLLCASSQTSSLVECWSLRKEGLPVNNIFQQISPVGEYFRLPSPSVSSQAHGFWVPGRVYSLCPWLALDA